MKSKRILLLSLIPAVFSGCWVEEAQPAKEKSLNIVADRLTSEDSTLIDRFSSQYHIAVKTEILEPKAILQRIRSDRFNADMDVLITEDAALRKELNELCAFKTIRNTTIFGRLERQFNNQHHYWIPVSHDPLIVALPRDTSGNCPRIDFRSWHRTDSLRPALMIRRHKNAYLELLSASSQLNRFARQSPGSLRPAENEYVYALSEFAENENRRDSLYPVENTGCRSFLIVNKRYVSRVNTISIYRYGRNIAAAESFLTYYTGNSYAVASGRNQLPARKHTEANWSIRSLSIR